MSTSRRLAVVVVVVLAVLATTAGTARAGYFPPSPGAIPSYRYHSYATYNSNPLAFNPNNYAPTLNFRPSTAGSIFGLPANYPTPSFNAYGLYSTYTFGPPYDFAWPGDVTYYPYGTTYTTTVVEPY